MRIYVTISYPFLIWNGYVTIYHTQICVCVFFFFLLTNKLDPTWDFNINNVNITVTSYSSPCHLDQSNTHRLLFYLWFWLGRPKEFPYLSLRQFPQFEWISQNKQYIRWGVRGDPRPDNHWLSPLGLNFKREKRKAKLFRSYISSPCLPPSLNLFLFFIIL
jgi:hypothetical protein